MSNLAKFIDRSAATDSAESFDRRPFAATLESIAEDGHLLVRDADSNPLTCEWLDLGDRATIALDVGDRLLVLPLGSNQGAVVLGRIGRYQVPQTPRHLALEAVESMSLKCGEASVELRAGGKVLVRGEDVTLRAKGTQRIRAGTVAIN